MGGVLGPSSFLGGLEKLMAGLGRGCGGRHSAISLVRFERGSSSDSSVSRHWFTVLESRVEGGLWYSWRVDRCASRVRRFAMISFASGAFFSSTSGVWPSSVMGFEGSSGAEMASIIIGSALCIVSEGHPWTRGW
jgi:hypothetical protein